MDVLTQIEDFTSKELIQTLQRGGLEKDLLDVITNQRIAGRHMGRLKKDAVFRDQLNLSVGDFFDIEDALTKGLSVPVASKDDTEHSGYTDNSAFLNISSDVVSPSKEVFVEPSSPSQGAGFSEMLAISPVGLSEDKQSNPSSSQSSNVSSNDDVLVEHLTPHQINDMGPYHRKVAKKQLLLYNEAVAGGIPCKKPSFMFNSSPECKRAKMEKTQRDKSTAAGSRSTSISTKSILKDVTNRQSTSMQSEPSGPEQDRQPSKSQACSSRVASTCGPSTSKSSNKVIPKTKHKDTPKKDIQEEHQPFLDAPNLDRPQKALIKAFLESPVNYTYSICNLLNQQEDLKDEVMFLQRDGVLFGKLLDKVLRCLVDYLYTLVPNPNLVSPEMRESLAVSIVASFPKLAQKPREGETPWSWLYNRESNTGKIANMVQSKQRLQKEKRLRGGGTDKRKKATNRENLTPVLPLVNQIPDAVLSRDAKFLKLLAANDTNKNDIVAKLKSTFAERRQLINEGKYTVNAVTTVFHHLRSFRGEMVELEFRGIHPGKENEFLMHYSDVALKLIALAEKNPVKYSDCLLFEDFTINAMLVLRKYLPKPVKCYKWENLMDSVGNVSDLIEVIPIGTNVQNSIETKRQHATTSIQPYLLAVGTYEKLESFFIVLGDSQYIMLPRSTEAVRALDLLFKIHFVLNVHYSLAWKNVYRFIAAHIYQLPPENKRLSIFTEKWLELCSL